MLPAMAFADPVDAARAKTAAKTFMNNNGVKATQLSDVSAEAGFNNLYVFNAERGFVVMAADDRVQPILGYSLTGHFRTENMPSNLRGWLQGYNDEIQYAKDNDMKAAAETEQLWNDLATGNGKAAKATIVVDAMIQSTWDQDPGYNMYCPYDTDSAQLTVTGCVATAMAQIMRYWEYPSQGQGSHSYTPSNKPKYGVQSVNYAQATYDWADMPLHAPNAEIAKLMYHCGVSVNMMYDIASNGGSGAYSNDIPSALTTYFRYKSGVSYKQKSSYGNTQWLNLIKAELDAGRPVQYNGSGSGGGHAFVCDGYDNSNNFHFNWGWSGSNDGFYSLSSLVPGSGGSGGGSYSFTNNQTAVIGIQPKDCTASTPSNLNITVEGRTATLTWNAASNAVAYSIYRDGQLIANASSTTYTDANLSYGTYAYYVKSVDSNGAKSSPTSTVTASVQPLATNLTVTQNGNGALLNWTEPEWCTPKSDDEVLTYGDGSLDYIYGVGDGSRNYYVGHRYPASLLRENTVAYKVSFYAAATGVFNLFLYTSTADSNYPQTQFYTQSITISTTGWVDFEFDPIQIDETKDLWTFIYDPDGKYYPFAIGSFDGSNGNYISYDSYNPTTALGTVSGYAFLIRTYITDGAFFYNLYDNTTTVASNLSGNSYTLNNVANNVAHQYTLKTVAGNGQTDASNMAGLTLGTASLGTMVLADDDRMTIAENACLTVTGNVSNNTPANLVLEDGAQLIHNTTGVKATVKKSFAGYGTGEGDWYLLAAPTTEAHSTSGIATGDYDLYAYDEATHYWWNAKGDPTNDHSFTTLAPGQAYLYANQTDLNAAFSGTLNPSQSTITKALEYTAEAGTLKGFNLVGNPYACNATVGQDFYVMNDDGTEIGLAESGREVKPCEGIFVKATGANQTVAFSKTGAKSARGGSLDLTVSRGRSFVDRARVRLGEGEGMEKLTLREGGTRLAIPVGNVDHAVVCSQGQGELPISFKTSVNGTYTLGFEIDNVEFNYLHLIDNLTGNDVDLLVPEPVEGPASYTFEAKTTDYPSRFRLLFSTQATEPEGSDQPIAFISNGEIIVNGEGTLQIVDMTGRILVCRDAVPASLPTNELTPGIYVLRLISGNSVRTQKVVIK